MKKQTNKGFTLIELLVVIAVIGVLSGVVMQSLNSARVKARNAQRLESVESIAKAFQVATTGVNNNQFPRSGGVPVCLGKASCWTTSTGGPYSGSSPFAVTVNNVLKTGLAGGTVPLDPFFNNTDGDAYAYNSDVSTGLQGPGAYLFWRMEGTGTECGRGEQYSPTPSYMCQLNLGPGTP